MRKGEMLHPVNNSKNKIFNFQFSIFRPKIRKILEKESEMIEPLINFLEKYEIPKIDAVAVTQGPGLEPALWTGLNFAKVLSLVWDKPFVPVNHMEGHILASLVNSKIKNQKSKIQFPSIALLLSGGHTELVLVKEIGKYKIIGQTRDDAVGEAYDKVARMLGLSYPGGPEISKLSEQYKPKKMASKYKLPRPMLNTPDYDFSFSGLKTAVLYTVKNITKITPKIKQEISYEFEQAVVDVLLHKTKKAIEKYKIKTLILGGGVVANKKIRENFQDLESEKLNILIPDIEYTGDNATMVAIAGYFRYLDKKFLTPEKALKIKANGNMNL